MGMLETHGMADLMQDEVILAGLRHVDVVPEDRAAVPFRDGIAAIAIPASAKPGGPVVFPGHRDFAKVQHRVVRAKSFDK